jgi:4-amino-4-deoxy-L-arabinose transferase-like glycosyltransferase
VQLVGDELYYVDTAASIARGEGHYSSRFAAFAAWPPGNAWWLSHFVAGSDESASVAPRAAVWAQVALGALICGLCGWLGRLLFDARTGLLAASIASVYPALVAFSHYLWAATLFTALLLLGLVGVVLAERHRRDRLIAVATGVAFGLATLTRESALPIAGGAALWWLWQAPPAARLRALARSALLLGTALLVVAPWTLRNHEKLDQLVLVSNAGWLALVQGNSLGHPNWFERDASAQIEFVREYRATPERERPVLSRERVRTLVRDEQPTWLFKKLALNLSLLFRPDSFLFWKLGFGAYGDIDLARSRFAMIGTMAAYLLVMTGAILGGAAAGASRWRFLVCISAPLVALHVVAFASARYRLPLMPVFIAFAAHAVVGGREPLRQLKGPRGIAAAALLLFLFAACVPHFHAEAARMWATGSYFE